MGNDAEIIFGSPIHHLSSDQLQLLQHLSRTFVPASHMNYYLLPGDWTKTKYEVMQGKMSFFQRNFTSRCYEPKLPTQTRSKIAKKLSNEPHFGVKIPTVSKTVIFQALPRHYSSPLPTYLSPLYPRPLWHVLRALTSYLTVTYTPTSPILSMAARVGPVLRYEFPNSSKMETTAFPLSAPFTTPWASSTRTFKMSQRQFPPKESSSSQELLVPQPFSDA